jgi:hypothetical protein
MKSHAAKLLAEKPQRNGVHKLAERMPEEIRGDADE